MILPMKYWMVIFTIVIFASIGLGFYGSTITSKEYNWPNIYQVDTVATHDTIIIRDTITIRDTIMPDTIKYIPNIFVTPSNNVTIDRINTVINGLTTNSDIKISIRDTKNIR